MNNGILESKNRTCRAYLEYIGMLKAGVPAIITRTQQGGRKTFSISEKPFAGSVILRINQGGLRDRETPADIKKLFREEVMPVLAKTFPEIGLKHTGNIELQFREDTIQDIKLTTH